jgi:hypothetical protein
MPSRVTQMMPDQRDTIAAKSRSTDKARLPRVPGPEHERLGAFVGRWSTKGRQHPGPFGPAADFTATESFELLTGGFFLIHRLDGTIGRKPMACCEIVGFDATSQCYSVHSYYSDGSSNAMQAHERNGTWTLHGDWCASGELLRLRCAIAFPDRDAMSSSYEYSKDGSSWTLFWEALATRS